MQVERFLEESAQRFPEKIALVSGDRRVTYRAIDEDANRLARSLAQRSRIHDASQLNACG